MDLEEAVGEGEGDRKEEVVVAFLRGWSGAAGEKVVWAGIGRKLQGRGRSALGAWCAQWTIMLLAEIWSRLGLKSNRS